MANKREEPVKGEDDHVLSDEGSEALFPIRKVVFSKTGIGYFERFQLLFVVVVTIINCTTLQTL